MKNRMQGKQRPMYCLKCHAYEKWILVNESLDYWYVKCQDCGTKRDYI